MYWHHNLPVNAFENALSVRTNGRMAFSRQIELRTRQVSNAIRSVQVRHPQIYAVV